MLESNTERKAGVSFIRIKSRIDHTNIPDLEQAIHKEFEQNCYNIIIDLSLVDVIFSMAIGVLWANCQKSRAKGGDLCLLGTKPAIQNILETLGIDSEMGQFQTEAECISYFNEKK